MAVSLKKGQKVSLTKSNGGKLINVMVGLGWHPADKSQDDVGFFGRLFGRGTQDIDCDASVFLCQGGKFVNNKDLVYFGNLMHNSGAVKHMGDNLTGEGEGDDEQIFVNLNKIPAQYDKLIFVVNIYKAVDRKQHFGMIKDAFIRMVDTDTHEELCRFNLSEDYTDMLSMVVGEIYRYGDDWKFNAIGSGTKDTGLDDLAKRFR
ncbi:MAG: TerD family protein [Selenomonadaceae bacterium]|nr:TerD family protein [Selenomonadaceae bacterium]